jgi:hypothetical protein
MSRILTEILKDINADYKNAEKYIKQKAALSIIFQHAYLKDKKFLLPDGAPPFKPSVEPLGMTPVNLLTELRRFYVFCRADLKQLQREQMFVGLLEGVHADEVALLLAIKDQKLNKLYPKLTKKWAEDVNLIPKTEPTKSKKDAVESV